MASSVPSSQDECDCMTLSEVVKQKEVLGEKQRMLDGRQMVLETQRNDMKHIDEVFRKWLSELRNVERNNQQVPYLWCIKDVCKMVLATLSDREGGFYGEIKRVYAAQVPCVSLLCDHLESLRKLVTKIDHDEVTYKPGFVEEIHHVLGLLTGMTGTMIDIYF